MDSYDVAMRSCCQPHFHFAPTVIHPHKEGIEAPRSHHVIVTIAEMNRPAMNALRYARLLGGQIVALHIHLHSLDSDVIEDQWKLRNIDIPLVLLDSPNDSVIEPLTEFVDAILQHHKKGFVSILLPVIAGLKWWQRFLHNQTERLIEAAFRNRAGVVTIPVPYSMTADFHEELQDWGKGI